MNWIRPAKRLAIYLRDGLACCYCGDSVEQGAKLTLDHLRPYAKGGSNAETNLVTCCHRCNSARGKRSWKAFSVKAAGYVNHGITGLAIVSHIEQTRYRRLDVTGAKRFMDLRGGFTLALQTARRSK